MADAAGGHRRPEESRAHRSEEVPGLAAALPAAFLVGLAADRTADEVTAFFPADFFVLIVGITALFAVAQLNGTLDWLLDGLLRLVGGRVPLVALVPFLIGAVLTAIGTAPAAATAVVAPVAPRPGRPLQNLPSRRGRTGHHRHHQRAPVAAGRLRHERAAAR
ncbi:hypothetical protein [Streptomyces olivaceus]|uniref:hypothetical protein n=1 Tax=Streptomyces olivaceus TaxID=47716 RepID=UPI0033BCF564